MYISFKYLLYYIIRKKKSTLKFCKLQLVAFKAAINIKISGNISKLNLPLKN